MCSLCSNSPASVDLVLTQQAQPPYQAPSFVCLVISAGLKGPHQLRSLPPSASTPWCSPSIGDVGFFKASEKENLFFIQVH